MSVATGGKWKVIYAPHMSTIVSLFSGGGKNMKSSSPSSVQQQPNLQVEYMFWKNGTTVSHATLDFDWLPKPFKPLILSTSGTFDSVDDDKVCSICFDQAW